MDRKIAIVDPSGKRSNISIYDPNQQMAQALRGMGLSMPKDMSKLASQPILSPVPVPPNETGRGIENIMSATSGIKINPEGWAAMLRGTPPSPNVQDQRDKELEYYDSLWGRALNTGKRDKQLTNQEHGWLVNYSMDKTSDGGRLRDAFSQLGVPKMEYVDNLRGPR